MYLLFSYIGIRLLIEQYRSCISFRYVRVMYRTGRAINKQCRDAHRISRQTAVFWTLSQFDLDCKNE